MPLEREITMGKKQAAARAHLYDGKEGGLNKLLGLTHTRGRRRMGT